MSLRQTLRLAAGFNVYWSGVTGGKATENGASDLPQGGSSLDLSPSDSCGSGGIYMWDEEGLDPLGALTTTPGSNATHRIGSFGSDLNSVVCSVT